MIAKKNLEIFERLGQGEFATVYRGRLGPGPEFVAVKAIPAQKLQTHPQLRALLDTEVRALSRISHKNVIRLVDCLSTDSEVDLVYEFCEGGDLRAAFERKLFDEPEALAVLHDLAEALLCLEAAGVVHRDLKPENLLLARGVVKLADFGLCRDLRGPEDPQPAHIGSYAFMAPEILSAFEYSCASDMYAAGVAMVELLTGRLPFDKQRLDELLAQKRAFRVGHETVPRASPAFCQLLDAMVAPEPARRPSPKQLLVAVQRLMTAVFAQAPPGAGPSESHREEVLREALARGGASLQPAAFPKQVLDAGFEDIDCWAKYRVNRKLLETRVWVLGRLEGWGQDWEVGVCRLLMSRSCCEVARKLLSFAGRTDGPPEEAALLHRLLAFAKQLEDGLLRQAPALPSFALERPEKLVRGNQLQDLLMARAARALKYRVDRSLADPAVPLRDLRHPLVTALLLLLLLDPQTLAFSLHWHLPPEAQPLLQGLESLSFQAAHLKLAALLQPFEAAAAADLHALLAQPSLQTSSSGDQHPAPSEVSTSFASDRASTSLSDARALPCLQQFGGRGSL